VCVCGIFIIIIIIILSLFSGVLIIRVERMPVDPYLMLHSKYGDPAHPCHVPLVLEVQRRESD
jgi:hypothetical protein